jgi:hypothetical protein
MNMISKHAGQTTLKCLFIACIVIAIANSAYAQAELAPWGNILGFRIDGQLMEFETSLGVATKDWSAIRSTGKEQQRPRYTRTGNMRTVTTTVGKVDFTETVTDEAEGFASVSVRASSKEIISENVFFCIAIPNPGSGDIQLNNKKFIPINSSAEQVTAYFNEAALSLVLKYATYSISFEFVEKAFMVIKSAQKNGRNQLYVFVAITTDELKANTPAEKKLRIKASGKIDTTPVTIQVDPAITGRAFDGFGGNFRIQNPVTDPIVIDYCLQNLRVAWGRVEMPWRFWQPQKSEDPIANAKNGKLHENVKKAMEMAQRLNKIGMPVILSAWSAPDWAIVGAPKFQPVNGVWGNPLDQASINEIYKSIGDYVAYLKEEYGVEIVMFSFNESDLGINIRQTGREHADLIKGLGKHFADRGLRTKLLLGDNSDATTYTFIDEAMNDVSTHPYIGAVSFHSWRGWDDATLTKWADAATKMNRPLLVGEGSIDAQAWGYPQIFEEPGYAIDEINLYVRLLNICQPASILQWQLTADYSPLAGGGIFGNNSALHPTQRFWNLKQLAATPKGLKALGLQSDNSIISAAALGNNGTYAIHLVNNGPARTVKIKGLPLSIASFQTTVTNENKQMAVEQAVPVAKGEASLKIEQRSYVTLTVE